ncbi:helix-turn-helix transcriptional regulator [Chromobacterium violaceum]|uniref:PadR family transcriptional regulator n=1 Tax=Chromobacterium violaceum TaxID=536 RepID=UPI001BE96403|nr:PadR family transcriptional regulator [Chromobacterium violaceum]MBT2867714.1 helix-turn-helix transcriptional regulator [Chromobacterium violaceum]
MPFNPYQHPLHRMMRAMRGPRRRGGEDEALARGRKFGADDLQLLLLALISEKSCHGYELIKELASRSNGYYSPSPGVIYPALVHLEETGQVTVASHGKRKCYSLADAGRERLAIHREHVELTLAKLVHIGRKMELARRAYVGEEIGEDGAAGWTRELIEARRALKHALLLRDQAGPDEQRRIAAILQRAAAEIAAARKPEDMHESRT